MLGKAEKKGCVVKFLKRTVSGTNHQFRPGPLMGWFGCLTLKAGLLCAKWIVIGILLTVALHGNLWAQSFRAAASAGVATGVTSFTVNKPTGTQENDVMIAAIAIRPYTATISAPSGWTLVRRTNKSLRPTLFRRLSTDWSRAAASRQVTPGPWVVHQPVPQAAS